MKILRERGHQRWVLDEVGPACLTSQFLRTSQFNFSVCPGKGLGICILVSTQVALETAFMGRKASGQECLGLAILSHLLLLPVHTAVLQEAGGGQVVPPFRGE